MIPFSQPEGSGNKRVEVASLLFFLGCAMMAAGLPLSKFLMSVSQFVLAGAWLIGGDFKKKWNGFISNGAALALTSVYLIHLSGFFYSDNRDDALHDLRISLPFLILPLLFSTSPALTRKQFILIVHIFILAVFAGTIAGTFEWIGINNWFRKSAGIPERILFDTRSISLFISHIRFSLLICIAVTLLIRFLFIDEKKISKIVRIVYWAATGWFIYFLFILESLSGIIILLCIFTGILLYLIFSKQKIKVRLISLSGIFLITGTLIFFVRSAYRESCPDKKHFYDSLATVTPNGNTYLHDTTANFFINCNPVWINICWSELGTAWEKRSEFSFEGKDRKDQWVKFTLVNFLTSKQLSKDAHAVEGLSPDEIRAVENGTTNVEAMHFPNLKFKIRQMVDDYRNYTAEGNPSGSSVIQRIEYWKAAIGIIKENFLFGVGAGDVAQSYEKQYRLMNSPLDKKWQLRAHNQFLAIGVSSGLIGLLWFIAAIVYPGFKENKFRNFSYLTFFITAVLSMLNEDTLESQAGITFFLFFNCLFLFKDPPE